MTYQEQFTDFKNEYVPKIAEHLLAIHSALQSARYDCSVISERQRNDYEQLFYVRTTGHTLQVIFVVYESQGYDDPELGINFALIVEDSNGRIIEAWDPFFDENSRWYALDETEAIAARFSALTNSATPQEVVTLVDKYRKAKQNEQNQTPQT